MVLIDGKRRNKIYSESTLSWESKLTEECLFVILFNRVTNYTPMQKAILLQKYRTARRVFEAQKNAEATFGKPFRIDGEPLEMKKEMGKARRELEFYQKNHIEIIDMGSSFYPERLKNIPDPPIVLFACGNCSLLQHSVPVGIVGSRKASNGGLNLAYSVAKRLSLNDVPVVSGLASGIDSFAHRGALDGSGFTIAVLGNGIDVVYPRENRKVYERIKQSGLLVSEFPLGTRPLKWNFPKRNRTISGLSVGVLIVEAALTSGALITAQFALDQGREVMAFPGRAASENFGGNNRLIKEGAHLVESAEDVLQIIGKETEKKAKGIRMALTPLEQDILLVIGDDKVSLEEIEKVVRKPISKVLSALIMLELKNAVVRYPGKIFSRVSGYGE
jgi:DNA processing protein